MKVLRVFIVQLVLLLALGAGMAGCAHGTYSSVKAPTALDTYVHAPDSHYSFTLDSTIPGDGYKAYVLSMTSQQYRTEKEVNRPIWTHWVTIIKPDKVATNKGLLYIGGGDVDKPAPTKVDPVLASIAVATQSVVTELRGVPNEPLVFIADETKSRTEDGIIAYTWDKFLKTGDSTWPLRLPMTKSAVRAMDTVTAFMGSEQGGKVAVNQFVVAGGSKRGWTTWTTAAEDKRVIAIVPIVINMLNIDPSFKHHYRAYGAWARAVDDYEEQGIMNWMGTKEYRELMKIEEPYQYRDRLTMPKFIINATGDQFFLPDSTRFYYNDLQGEKLLRMVPNGDHGLGGTDARESLAAYYQEIVTGKARPKYSWKFERDGSIRVKTEDKPKAVTLWQATNPEGRDFRVETIGKVWKSEDLAAQADGTYIGRVAKPAKGWTCFLVELTYDTGGPVPLKVTTECRVTPDTLPFKDFKPKVTPVGYLSKKPAGSK
ncbi:MAG: PhoPQ-activated pathogenicity-related family protein [Candidatus Hydrogenedentes bacterium]|nr:PhoPQ-activated pathogenicity-related family protein [Candidatus Hydrogenedentota bacterium]